MSSSGVESIFVTMNVYMWINCLPDAHKYQEGLNPDQEAKAVVFYGIHNLTEPTHQNIKLIEGSFIHSVEKSGQGRL